MIERLLRASAYALLMALGGACLGGQTGEPSSLACGREALPASATWRNLTTQQVGQAFAGTHSAALHWVQEPRGSASATPVTIEDSLAISVYYEGQTGMLDCGTLHVPVSVEIATSASAIAESGAARLSLTSSTRPLRATLEFHGGVVAVNVTLTEVEAGEPPSGILEPLTDIAPGGWATFPNTN